MKKLKKIVLLITITVGIILSVSGCKKKEAMTDENVVKVVKQYVTNSFPEYSFDGCDVWINDRTTYLEDGYDYVDVSVNVYCDEIEFYLDYSASFYYDEKEWHLDDMTVTDGEHHVLMSDCSEELARGYIDGEYYGVEFVNRELDLSNSKDTFIFTGKKTDYWGSELTHTIEVKFYYSLYNGWEYSKTNYRGEGILNLDPGSGYVVAPEIPEIYDRNDDMPELIVQPVENDD